MGLDSPGFYLPHWLKMTIILKVKLSIEQFRLVSLGYLHFVSASWGLLSCDLKYYMQESAVCHSRASPFINYDIFGQTQCLSVCLMLFLFLIWPLPSDYL